MISKPFTVVALFFFALSSVARAETAADATDRPWATGIGDDAQKQALAIFEEGNKLFENSQHAAALARYRDALKVWDHPAIRYNAAVALINLDQPLAANENLEIALRYGAAPFNPETHQQALTYRKLLRGQLAELKVACTESGASVTLDGATLFDAPGEATRWLLPGAHQLVARKTGFLTETRSLSLLPGKPAVETLSLQEIGTLPTRTVRRWPVWKPWAVVGGGALLALAGIPLMLDVKHNLDAYDAGVRNECAMGCAAQSLSQPVRDLRDRAHTENVVAVSLFTVGGAVIASGVALLILNQPRVVAGGERSRGTVVPLVGRDVVGLSIAFER
ncbi:MAG TPA: hypothetical protein VN903_24270 [Polyangia bacterium]|nr:hypothetical protein [Polyangia bacterium]